VRKNAAAAAAACQHRTNAELLFLANHSTARAGNYDVSTQIHILSVAFHWPARLRRSWLAKQQP